LQGKQLCSKHGSLWAAHKEAAVTTQ
jgi:hypothetical protein